VAVARRRRDDHRVGPLLDAGHRRAEDDLTAHVGGDRPVERRRAGREAPAQHRGLQVPPETVIGGGYPAEEVEHRRLLRRGRGARGDPELQQVAHAGREAEGADPVARRHVELLQALGVGRAARVMAASGSEQRGDRQARKGSTPA
jgi:hypothetical protein